MGTIFLLLCGAVMWGCGYELYTDYKRGKVEEYLNMRKYEREKEFERLKRDADQAIEEFNNTSLGD